MYSNRPMQILLWPQNAFTPIKRNAIPLLLQMLLMVPHRVSSYRSCCSARVKVARRHVVYVFWMASSCMNYLKSSDQLACSTQTEAESYTDSEAHYSSFLCEKDQNTAKSKSFSQCVLWQKWLLFWTEFFSNWVFQKLGMDSWAWLPRCPTGYKPSLTYMWQCEHTQYQTQFGKMHTPLLC
jgi:hypothetical protein